MRKRAIIISALIFAVISCTKDRNPQPPMGWTAQNAVDKFCGVYALESAEWDGAPLDLDGDGIANPSFLEELLSGTPLGFQTSSYVIIYPAFKLNTPTQINAYLYYGDFNDNNPGGYSLDVIQFYYNVNVEGNFSFILSGTTPDSHNDATYDATYCRFDNISAGLEGDLFVISGDTDYFDFITLTAVSGRETFRYRCISTKQKQ